MTADNILVLSHDDTLDRVSDAVSVFGAENILVRDKTLAELKQLNMAAQFVNDAGEMPYADLHGDAVPEELKILSLDEVLDYLTDVSYTHLARRDAVEAGPPDGYPGGSADGTGVAVPGL